MLRWLNACSLVVLVATGCSGDDDSPGGGGASGNGPDPGDGSCVQAGQCPGSQVCDPESGMCTDSLSCSDNAACGIAAHCSSGMCQRSATGSPCDDDTNCAGGSRCIGGVCGCDGEIYGTDNVPANVLIVLDRSNSMLDEIDGRTKWEIALEAITALLAARGDGIRFGLMLYPGFDQSCEDGMECGPGVFAVDPADGTASAIDSYLGAANTCSFGTPTAEALTEVVDYMPLADTMRNNYVLLITDGQSTCEDPVPVVESLAGQSPPVQTFVVGFGDAVDPDELNGLAMAGGTAIANGPPSYYQADDADALASALSTIAGSVLSCAYTLSSQPADPDELYVYADEMPVDRDTTHADGWDYDSQTRQLTFYGATCDALLAGTVSDLSVAYGCPLGGVD